MNFVENVNGYIFHAKIFIFELILEVICAVKVVTSPKLHRSADEIFYKLNQILQKLKN